MRGGLAGKIAYAAALTVGWPVVVIGALRLAWSESNDTHRALGVGLLVAAPGILALGAALQSAGWRRAAGISIGTVTLLAVTAYGSVTITLVECVHGTPAQVAPTMVPIGALAGIGATITAWLGGHLAAGWQTHRIALALGLGWLMLTIVLVAAAYRQLANTCFGY